MEKAAFPAEARESVSISGRVRALRRLGAFLGYGIGKTAAAAVRARGVRNPESFFQQQAREWAVMLEKLCGLSVRMEGRPPEGAALFVSNHRSYIDIIPLLARAPATFMAKAELRRWPVVGWSANVVRTIFVARDDPQSRHRAREAVTRRLRNGLGVVVYPEGTTHAGPGILPFRKGVFRIAADGAIPVIPVAVSYENAQDAWVGDDTFLAHFLRVFARPGIDVRIAFGPVLVDTDPERLRLRAWEWIDRNVRFQELPNSARNQKKERSV